MPGAWANELLFSPQIEMFGRKYDVITPNISQFDDIEKMAEAIINEYRHVYCLVGLSMGGFIVQEILTKHPSFAEKAILIGTYAHALDSDINC